MSGIKEARGKMHRIVLEKACIVGKLRVYILEDRMGGDDKVSSMLSSHIDSLVQSHVPMDSVKWSKVFNVVKSYVMSKVLDDLTSIMIG
ncbi:hypothetical protein CJ030_MR5G021757 [Morella rubra]|uniref:Uncharacterized protein n=1 Tax=Morella rubra TaxID=262757 RepID=A0A6A1VJV3_9ROSI|nr:hypothetical protein CJ030_MR5G021757 [Morella rubra]